MSEAIEKLLANPRIWRGRVQAGDQGLPGLASGYPKLDQRLPGGGWPRNALTEILLEHYGTGELQLLMPALSYLSQPRDDAAEAGWITWGRLDSNYARKRLLLKEIICCKLTYCPQSCPYCVLLSCAVTLEPLQRLSG